MAEGWSCANDRTVRAQAYRDAIGLGLLQRFQRLKCSPINPTVCVTLVQVPGAEIPGVCGVATFSDRFIGVLHV